MNRLSLIKQEGALRSYFPQSLIMRKGEDELIWIDEIQPKAICNTYTIMLHYTRKTGVRVYVLEPKKLELAQGKTLLPHVYSTKLQRLCLYYPPGREFHYGMLYVHTIIPWASEWLYHYEFWVTTGEWHGGGIDHENTAEQKKSKKLRASELLM